MAHFTPHDGMKNTLRMKAKTLVLTDTQAAQLSEMSRAAGISESELVRAALEQADFSTIARQRLERFERAATAAPSTAGLSPAAKEHLRQHRKLGGLPPEET